MAVNTLVDLIRLAGESQVYLYSQEAAAFYTRAIRRMRQNQIITANARRYRAGLCTQVWTFGFIMLISLFVFALFLWFGGVE